MPQARDEAGNIWEVDAQGNPVSLVQAAGASQGQVFSLPQNPKDVAAQADRDADNRRADASLALQQQNAADRNPNADLDRELKQLQLAEARAKAGEGATKTTRLRQLVNQIDRVQELYEKGPGQTKGAFGLQDYLPTDANAAFDVAGASLSQQGLAAFRQPGSGTVSDRDAIMFDKANLPTASTRDVAIEEILSGLRTRVNEEFEALGQPTPNWTTGQQAEDEISKVAAIPDNSPPGLPPVNEGGNDPAVGPQTIASGATRFVDNPRARSTIASLINAGAGYSTVAAAAKEAGGRAPSIQEFNAVQSWMKANPGKQYPASSVEAGEYEPLTMLQKAAGSPLGAGVASYANAATAGTASALAGEQGKGALDAMEAANPGAALTGNILGGITGALGAEFGLASRLAGTAAAKYAPRIADTMFGAATGFNAADDGQGLTGAAMGGVAGFAGGYLGEKALRGAGGVLQGATAPAARKLREAGIPLTIGQVLGEGGALGRGVKKVEDALTAIPGVGNMVEARRMEGLQGFNDAAFDLAAETTGNEITDTGARGVAQLKQAVSDAYGRALDPVSINADDAALVNDLGGAIASAQRIPNVNNAQDAAMLGLESRITGAIDPETEMMTGRGFQEAYRGLARTGRERANSDYGYEVGQVMRQGQDALGGALERQNPGAFDAFVNANAANRRANVLASAINPNAPQQLITPAQLGRADFNSTSKLENRINAAAGNGPFFDLAEAGQAVLPSQLPDSGTWTRMLTGGLLTGTLGGGGAALGGAEGAGTGAGLGLGATLALMAGGSKPAQRAAVAALLDRPQALTRAGKLLADLAKFGGGIGTGTAAPLLVGQ